MYGKIIQPQELASRLPLLRVNASRLIFTNGCFDILHAGHVEYLMAAKSLGSKLVVGVNTDASVSDLKGDSRPYNNLEDRMVLLAALQCVDAVIPFTGPTPIELIKTIRPHILVKGGDYTVESVVGAQYVSSYGGEVRIIPFKNGYSTTRLIDKIRKSI